MATEKKRSIFSLGLGLFCAGAGTIQVIAPRKANDLFGLQMGDVGRQKLVFRALGVRDLLFALAFILTSKNASANKRWLQVFEVFLIGDTVMCGQALTKPKANLFTWLATLNSIFFALIVLVRLGRKG